MLILVFLAMAMVEIATCVTLFAIDADSTVTSLATILILGVGVDTSSRVVMRDGPWSSDDS